MKRERLVRYCGALFGLGLLLKSVVLFAGEQHEALLRSKLQQISTLTCEIEVSSMPGKDLSRYADDANALAHLFRKEEKPEHAKTMEALAKTLRDNRGSQATKTRFKCYFQSPRQLRFEEIGADGKLLSYGVYSGSEWIAFVPAEASLEKNINYMQVFTENRASAPFFLVGAGLALPPNNRLYHLVHNKRLEDLGQVPWPDYLSLLSNSGILLRQKAPTGEWEFELVPRKDDKWAEALYRVRLWVDSKNGLAPVKAICEDFEPENAKRGAPFLSVQEINWKQPSEPSQGGVQFPIECSIHFRQKLTFPGSAQRSGGPLVKAYEYAVHNIRFLLVNVNEPLDSSLFKVVPPKNTAVTDEVAGKHYIVGSAGDIIKTTALNRSSEFEPVTGSSKLLYIILIASVVLLLSLLIVYFRKQSLTKRS